MAFVERGIDDLLEFSQLDADLVELVREPTDLARLVERVLARSVAPGDRSRITIVASTPIVVMVDASRIERVLANLLVKALVYANTHGVIHVRVEARHDHARVSVFPKLRRAPPSHAREGGDLRLYVSRKIIEAHGGRIGLDDQPGDGAELYFELPRMLPNMTAW